MKLSIEEMAKLIVQLQLMTKRFQQLEAKIKGPADRIEQDKLSREITVLNKKRKELLPLYTAEEISEMRKIATAM